MARKVLIDVDDELLERFDAYWRVCGFPSRRAAIRHALDVRVAQQHASAARDRQQQAEPNPWLPRGVTHTFDRADDERPITAALTDDF